MPADKNNVTKRSEQQDRLSWEQMDENFQELINVIGDVSNLRTDTDLGLIENRFESLEDDVAKLNNTIYNHVDSNDPDTKNDETKGFIKGSIWFNETTGNSFICTNSKKNSASWASLA